MFNKKRSICIFLAVTLTSCPVLADRGGFGNGGGPWGGSDPWQGGAPWHGSEQGTPENFGTPPGQIIRQTVPPVQIENIQRQELQPATEQIKRDYNQIQREERQQFQQNWKKIKK